jgi:hypothetical protein
MVRVNVDNGALASIGDPHTIWEAFIPDTEPQEGQQRNILDGSVTGSASNGAAGAFSAMPSDGVTSSTDVISPATENETDTTVVKTPPIPANPSTMGTGGLY